MTNNIATKNVTVAIIMTIFGYFMFSVGDAIVKHFAGKFHVSQLFVCISVVVFVTMVLYGWQTQGRKAFTTKKPKLLLIRALVSQFSAFFNILALPHIEFTTFYIIVFTSPFWVLFLSWAFMGERLQHRHFYSTFLCFLAVLYILKPTSESFNPWTILVLMSAFTLAATLLLSRKIGTNESRSFMIMWGAAMSIFLALPFLSAHYVAPLPHEWPLLFILGLVSGIGVFCISYGFQHAPSASSVAPYHYTQIIWGALMGYFIFHEVPTLDRMLGGAVIILTGLYLILHERRKAQQQ